MDALACSLGNDAGGRTGLRDSAGACLGCCDSLGAGRSMAVRDGASGPNSRGAGKCTGGRDSAGVPALLRSVGARDVAGRGTVLACDGTDGRDSIGCCESRGAGDATGEACSAGVRD